MRAAAWATILALVATLPMASTVSGGPRVSHTRGLANKKETKEAEEKADRPLLATLVQLHTDECIPLDTDEPDPDRFSWLLRDRITGSSHALDPRLLGLLRDLSAQFALARIELVSGYRSPKLNEMLRKKGHHVASHSQHSLGNALDFRVVPAGATAPLDPRVVEAQIRQLGWDGGVGVYLGKDDRFVHADVGRNRRWDGQ